MRLWQCCYYKNIYDTLAAMFQILFTDNCAQNYTFDGKTNSKGAFKELTIYSIILGKRNFSTN